MERSSSSVHLRASRHRPRLNLRTLIQTAALCAAALAALRPSLARAQDPAEPAPAPRVDSIEVTGNRRATTQTVVNTAAIPLRTPISIRDIQRAIKALFALGQFDDVVLSRRAGDAGEEILVIAVTERPLLASWGVRGVDKLTEGAVRDRVTLAAGRPLDPAALTLSQVRIDSLYEAEGYYLAEVRPNTQVIDDSGAVRVVFDIEEGRRVAIAAVRIDGNQAFVDEQIVSRMRSKPEGFWWFQPGEYSETSLREDIEQRLPEFYGSNGYVDFRVVRDTLEVEPGSGKATLVIEVDEGLPYRVGTVTVEGNRFFSTEQVMALNPFVSRRQSGITCLFRRCEQSETSYFDRSAWDAATQRLRTNYANEGYIYADIQAAVEPAASDSAGGPPVVNLVWRIAESRPAIINRIDIVGNDVTHERIIREAIVVLPGDVFAQDRIIRSYQNISNLNFFQQPLPFPDTRPDPETGDVDLIFRVQERHTGSVNFGASVGQGTGIGGFLGLEEPNLFGQGKRGRVQWQFGRNINDFNLSYSDPQLFGSRVSGTVELNNSRVRYTVADLGRIYSRGISLSFGFPLPRSRYTRLFVTGALDWERYTGSSSQLSAFQCSNCFRTALGASLVRDTRIDLPFPTGGSYHTVALNANGPFGTGTATFQKLDLEGRWYTQVGRLGGTQTVGGVKFVFGLSAKSGFIVGNAGPFFRQLYSMGGTQFGIPLRGYEEFGITPAGVDPNAGGAGGVSRTAFGRSYFATTAEFGMRLSQMIYVATFYDAGNVWATAGGFNPTRLVRGAGVGVSLITPLGPIGLDMAYGFDKLNQAGAPNPGWKLHFRIGNFF